MIKFTENYIHLKVKKAPVFILIVLYAITFSTALIPFLNLIFATPHVMVFVGIFLFGYITYILLKISLWNTFGQEYIEIAPNQIQYTADYKWFKSKTRVIDSKSILFAIQSVGYEEDRKAVLVLKLDDGNTLETVTKINIEVLEDTVKRLHEHFKDKISI